MSKLETSAPVPKGIDPEKFRRCELQVTKKLMDDNPNLSHDKAKVSAIRICIKQLKGEMIENAISSLFDSQGKRG
jgi:hypothetical protein